jgi:hypothetical protein
MTETKDKSDILMDGITELVNKYVRENGESNVNVTVKTNFNNIFGLFRVSHKIISLKIKR